MSSMADLIQTDVRATRVCIDNVAEYYFEEMAREKEKGREISLADFPKCVSSWPYAFVEFRIPKKERLRAQAAGDTAPYRIGFLTTTTNRTKQNVNPLIKKVADVQENLIVKLGGHMSTATYVTTVVLWVEYDQGVCQGPIHDWTVFYDERGEILRHPNRDNSPLCASGLLSSEYFTTEEAQRRFAATVGLFLYPLFVGFSFANCRNVTRTRVDADPKLQRARER